MHTTATGSFEVNLQPQPPSDAAQAADLRRMAIDKTFAGDLIATSQGVMLSVMTDVEGSAGYVALECVTGTLHGRVGSFMLQHSGQMDRGAQSLAINVVPDSATGDLVGLRGTMQIEIIDEQHTYRFEYKLPG